MDIIKQIRDKTICDIPIIMHILKAISLKCKAKTSATSKQFRHENKGIDIDIVSDYDEKRDNIKISIVISNMLSLVAISATINANNGNRINYGIYNGGILDDDLTAIMVHDSKFADIESMLIANNYNKLSDCTFGELFIPT